MQNEFLQLQFPGRVTGPLAIRHVTVIPMDTNRSLPDHTIVIEDGHIQNLVPSAGDHGAARPGITVVDGTGQFLMPGLADMYTHYREPSEAPLYLAHGITTARTSGNLFQLAMEWSAASGNFPSPRIITVSPTIDGIGPSGRTDMPHGVPLTRPEDAAPLVRQYVERGYHQITPFSLLTPENLRALGTAAAECGVRMAGNCPNAVSWEEAIEVGMTGFHQLHLIARNHMAAEFGEQTYWDRFDPAPGTKLDFEKIRRLGGLLAKRQIWSLPTLMFHQRASQPQAVSMAHPALRYVPRSTIEDWESTLVRWSHRGRVSVDEWRRLASERARAFHRVTAIFHEEGVPQLTCTDGLNPYNVQGDALHQEIENFAAAGMSAYEALRCATAEAARFMGEEDRWGTIAVGKRADMILTRANPLYDVRATRDPEAVFVNGYFLSRTVLDGLLEQRAALVKRPAPIASTVLPPANGAGIVAQEGAWLERICNADFGRYSFRHTRMPDGGWQIEESHSGANPRHHPERRSSRLHLAADLTIRSCEYDIESFVGKETGSITWSRDEGYRLQHRAVDGFKTKRTLPGEARVPSEQMVQSLVPLLAKTKGRSTMPALDAQGMDLDAQGVNLGAAEITIAPVDDGGLADEARWKFQISRLGQRAEQTFRIGPDGLFRGLTETMVLLWPRELIPVDATDGEGS
jgi:Amidohydrolase family